MVPSGGPKDPPPPLPGAEAVVAAMVGDALQPALVADHAGAVLAANAHAAAALGLLDAEALVGRAAPATVSPGAHDPVVVTLGHFARADGEPARVTAVLAPIDLPDRPGTVIAFTDVVEADDEALHRNAPARVASLRRVATEISVGMAMMRIFATAARQTARAAELPLLHVVRVEGDDAIAVAGGWSLRPCKLGAGISYLLDDVPGAAQALRTRTAVRVDDLRPATGRAAELLRDEGIMALAWAPIVVRDRAWGALLAGRAGPPRPSEAGALAALAELLAAHVAELDDRTQLARLLDEQAALRRVATLVARDAPSSELLAAVAREIGLLLGLEMVHVARYDDDGAARGVAGWALRGDGTPLGVVTPDDGVSLPSLVRRSGQQRWVTDYGRVEPISERLRAAGIRSVVGVPLVVDGRLWGVLAAGNAEDRRPPPDIGDRIAEFAELMATAISNLESRAARTRLARTHDAMRHIATAVARDHGSEALFDEILATVGGLLDTDFATLTRFDDEEDVTTPLAMWSPREDDHAALLGRRFPLRPDELSYKIKTTGQAARFDGASTGADEPAPFVCEVLGARSAVGAPVVVDDRVWGAVIVHVTGPERLPEDTEQRLVGFGELIATAVDNRQAHAAATVLADEQAALRQVATLVAHDAPADAVLAAVGRELGGLMAGASTEVARYDDGVALVLASWGERVAPAGKRLALEGDNVLGQVWRTGRPARITAAQWSGPTGEYALSLGLQSAVGAPIVVDGRTWGALTVVSSDPEPLPDDTEQRTARFADLVGAAISNIAARERLAASRARVIAAADEERQRVVRDLHDGAQQRLVHTILVLELALAGDPIERALVMEALEHARRGTDELRALARGILPEALVAGGLAASAVTLAELAPVPVALDVLDQRLPRSVEATAYFVVAEALTNLAKHADARTAAVSARVEDGALRIVVRDDGVGGARADGKGLTGLADRLAVHEGLLDVASAEGGGTVVTATIPLPDGDGGG